MPRALTGEDRHSQPKASPKPALTVLLSGFVYFLVRKHEQGSLACWLFAAAPDGCGGHTPGNCSSKPLRTPGKHDCPQAVGETVFVTGSPHRSGWWSGSDTKLCEDFWGPTGLRQCPLVVIKKVRCEEIHSMALF